MENDAIARQQRQMDHLVILLSRLTTDVDHIKNTLDVLATNFRKLFIFIFSRDSDITTNIVRPSIRMCVLDQNPKLTISMIKESSRVIKRHKESSRVIKRHQVSSSVIKRHQVSSSII